MNWWLQINGKDGLCIRMDKAPNRVRRFLVTLCFGFTWEYK